MDTNTTTKRETAIDANVLRDESGLANGLTLAFANGQSIVIGQSQLSVTIQLEAMMHGLKQKLVDAAAISRNPDTGRSATVDDKYRAVRAVYDRLLAGDWNAKRGDGEASGGGLLFRALSRLYPERTAEQLRTYLSGMDKAKQAALRGNPKVKAVIDELRAADAAAVDTSDTDAMLDALGAMGDAE